MGKSSIRKPVGSNNFLFASPLVDVMHRLGFKPASIMQLEEYMWDHKTLDINPDDLASVLMQVLPWETDAEADERRRRGRFSKSPLFDWSSVRVFKEGDVPFET